MYFGERHFDTLNEFDTLTRRLRRSRTGTLDFLLNYYKQTEKRRVEPVILYPPGIFMKRDKEYFRRLKYFKKMGEDSFKRRGQSLNKYQLVSLVSVLLDESYRK